MKLKWDQVKERFFETGVKKGVLYMQEDGAYPKGVAWSGLTAVTESPSGAEATALYADNIKYLNLTSAEEFEGTIEAYTYPDEFNACQGYSEVAKGVIVSQQAHKPFGLSYVTQVGNDEKGSDFGYKLHLVYGATAQPSEKGYETINDSPEAITFSWEFTTTPVEINDELKPSASLVIDSTKVDAAKLKALEDVLYGTEENEPRLPLPSEVIHLLTETAGA